MTKLTASTKFKVRFSEVDSIRIVWHGNYLKYFEDARDAFATEHGLDLMKLFEQDAMFAPLVKTEMEHKTPLRYGDEGIAEVTYEDCAAAKVIFHYRILNARTGVVAVEGKTIQAFTDTDYALQLYLPDYMLKWKKAKGLL
ncbi:MAG: acyl-CoA thioester hydrolase [Bacteroidia bacterium]